MKSTEESNIITQLKNTPKYQELINLGFEVFLYEPNKVPFIDIWIKKSNIESSTNKYYKQLPIQAFEEILERQKEAVLNY